jgi:rSAM/selenodomain-associated transferase 1
MVKTRLAPADPAWGARAAHAALLDTLGKLSGLSVRRMIAFAPAESAADFAALAGHAFEIVPQGEGDLGKRIARFIADRLNEGAEAVVVIGADSPTLPPEFVAQAFQLLQGADIVLGPACDGGYYLIGCRGLLPPIFEDVAWGTSQVLAQTIGRLSESTWRLALLPPWYDVDTPADWSFLCGHVAALRRAGLDPRVPKTEALMRDTAPS